MRYLYAPWRDVYFAQKKQGCIFCRAGKVCPQRHARHREAQPKRACLRDGLAKALRKKFVLYCGKYCFAMLNIFPYTTAHIMVAPYRHCADFSKLGKKELGEMMEIAQKMITTFRHVFKCQGFNIGINQGASAGAGFEGHIHLHVVGRWPGDTNFMTAVSKIRVVSSDPEKIYKTLKKHLK